MKLVFFTNKKLFTVVVLKAHKMIYAPLATILHNMSASCLCTHILLSASRYCSIETQLYQPRFHRTWD